MGQNIMYCTIPTHPKDVFRKRYNFAKRYTQTGSSETLIGWKSGKTSCVPLWDRIDGAWLWTLCIPEALFHTHLRISTHGALFLSHTSISLPSLWTQTRSLLYPYLFSLVQIVTSRSTTCWGFPIIFHLNTNYGNSSGERSPVSPP